MYLLTMGWFLAHTSLAMTPEHSATNGEYSSLISARAGHSKSMCLLSPKAPVTSMSGYRPVESESLHCLWNCIRDDHDPSSMALSIVGGAVVRRDRRSS